MFGVGFYSKRRLDKISEYESTFIDKLIRPGVQFPPVQDRERISKYKRLKKTFKGRQIEVYERATELLKDTPQAPQLQKLYIAVNLADIIVTKPADLLVGEPPSFESGLPDDSEQQMAINRYVEENNLAKLIHESALGNGYRGDSWFKIRYGYRQDFSEVLRLGGEIPADIKMEPIIEHINAEFVFPEVSHGNVKEFKAVNIATVEYVISDKTAIPFLNVERHLPGYIVYERYQLHEFEGGVDTTYGYQLQVYNIGDPVPTGRTEDIVATGVPYLLVQHIPYKSVDDDWKGIGGIEKMETLLTAINDRLVQIDYILWKHSDPNSYGPELEGVENSVRSGGVYIPTTKDDVTPGYMTWNGQLDAAFKELEVLISLVFQQAETPQWLFGTVLGSNSGGNGTSHTDSAAIKARFMPILSKVKRIRTHYDTALRDALWKCQMLDVQHGGYSFKPVYPTIGWQDGIPKSAKEEAEIMQIRTGNKPTIDVQSAIERLDGVEESKAQDIIASISADEKAVSGFVNPSIFNAQGGGAVNGG